MALVVTLHTEAIIKSTADIEQLTVWAALSDAHILFISQCFGSSCLAGCNTDCNTRAWLKMTAVLFYGFHEHCLETLYHQPLSDVSWVSFGSSWAMWMPNLLWSISKVNCVVHTRREKTQQKGKLGLAWLLIQDATKSPPCYELASIYSQREIWSPGRVRRAAIQAQRKLQQSCCCLRAWRQHVSRRAQI